MPAQTLNAQCQPESDSGKTVVFERATKVAGSQTQLSKVHVLLCQSTCAIVSKYMCCCVEVHVLLCQSTRAEGEKKR